MSHAAESYTNRVSMGVRVCMLLLHSVTIRRHALMLLYVPKFKAELINERRILIGYWLAQQLIAVRDVKVMCCTCTGWTSTFVQCTMCVCMHCAMLCGIKWGQS